MKLRISPWYTDSCTDFLNNLFKWWPLETGKPLALEIGGGNSTLYFLGKGFRVLTIEDSPSFIHDIESHARQGGYRVETGSTPDEGLDALKNSDLVLLQAGRISPEALSLISSTKWSIIVNDGIDRAEVLSEIYAVNTGSLIILDNCEYCANWGARLERGSAHPTRIPIYREFLRSNDWHCYLFEQAEGRDGYSSPDRTGWEAPHRWITGVGWHKSHLLQQLMVTSKGLPLVTPEGINDGDIESLAQRCPFDWDNREWLTDSYTNYFDLHRKRS